MESLIQMVRENPVLYDTNHTNYMRTKLKNRIWNQIAQKLKYPNGYAAKERWRKLRDCHRDALRRQKKRRNSNGHDAIKKWAYQKQMEFLVSFMSSKATINDNAELFSETYGENCIEGMCENTDYPAVEEIDCELAFNDDKSSVIKSTTVMEGNNFDKLNEDGLYHFFMSMYNCTKNMHPRLQLQIKRKLFDAVTQAEEHIMTNIANTDPFSGTEILEENVTHNASKLGGCGSSSHSSPTDILLLVSDSKIECVDEL